MKTIIVEPGKHPRTDDIKADLKSLQKMVGGYIQVVYPFEDRVCIICNEEGKLLGLPFNRTLKDENGEIYDVLVGTFIIAGAGASGFVDLTDAQVEKYTNVFYKEESFIGVVLTDK